MFIIIGLCVSLCVLSIPILKQKRLDIFNPFLLFVISFSIGGLFRAVFLLYDRFGSVMAQGVTIEGLKLSVVVSLAGSFLIIVGYYLAGNKELPVWNSVFNNPKWNESVLNILSLIYTFIGIYALYMAVGRIELSYSKISIKRSFESGYLLWAIDLLYVAFLVQFVSGLKKSNKTTLTKLFYVLVLLMYIMVAFFLSKRGLILKSVVIPVAIYHYYRRRFNFGSMLIGGGVFYLIFVVMSNLRSRTFIEITEISELLKRSFVNVFLEGHYMCDITTLSRVLQDVPEKVHLQYGSTLIAWVAMPVPRSIWQGKPQNLGQLIGESIYNQGVGIIGGGVPPPLWAELYLNFHLIGVLVGSIIFGYVTRLLYNSVNVPNKSILLVSLYAMSIMVLVAMFNGGVSKPIVVFLKLAVPFFATFILSAKRS